MCLCVCVINTHDFCERERLGFFAEIFATDSDLSIHMIFAEIDEILDFC